jgi:hypothetical protein
MCEPLHANLTATFMEFDPYLPHQQFDLFGFYLFLSPILAWNASYTSFCIRNSFSHNTKLFINSICYTFFSFMYHQTILGTHYIIKYRKHKKFMDFLYALLTLKYCHKTILLQVIFLSCFVR